MGRPIWIWPHFRVSATKPQFPDRMGASTLATSIPLAEDRRTQSEDQPSFSSNASMYASTFLMIW